MKGTAVNTRVRTKAEEQVSATTEISKASIYTVGVVSALLGVWGVACFVGGLVASGGPLSFVGSWFNSLGL